ncbi:hypothetical protein FQZ97_1164230 [compost metagenome]
MLGQPALVMGLERRRSQGQAFFPEQGIAAISRTKRDGRPIVLEADDIFVLGVAGPRDIRCSGRKRRANGV